MLHVSRLCLLFLAFSTPANAFQPAACRNHFGVTTVTGLKHASQSTNWRFLCSQQHPQGRTAISQKHGTLQMSSTGDWQSAQDPSTGQTYWYNTVTQESSWEAPAQANTDQAAPTTAADGSGLPLSFMQGTKVKVAYKTILDESLAACQAARAAGLQKLQIEFPLDAKDEGSTLVKRFETLVSFTTQFAEGLGLPRVQRVGERVMIRDNVNPAGGGEYLTNEGLVGFRCSNADGSEEVLLVLVAGVDETVLNDLENWIQGNTGEDLGLEVPGTGQLSSLFTVGQVDDMSVSQGATIVLINSGLDKIMAGGQGLFGFGGPSAFLKEFQPAYYIKRISTGTGFLSKDFRDAAWKLWGVPRDATEAKLEVVRTLENKPALWEAEQVIKQFCRA